MKENKKSGIKQVLHILKISALVLVLIIALALGGIFTAHRLSLRSEAKKIVDYGQKLEVFDGTMNVLIEGKGEETIVLLTGYGTASPSIDFKPLIDELKSDYRVVVIEPFGYGLSGQTERERTAENMVEEIHDVVKQLNIDSFILMGHSIAGIYGLNYVNTFPEAVKAFVGIDSSVPNQPWPGFDDRLINFVQKSGIFRLIVKLNPESFMDENMNEESSDQLRMITMKNMGNETVRNELKSLGQSFNSAKSLAFPKEVPLLLFVAEASETSIKGWLELHEQQIENSSKGKVVELPGTHYLHHTQSKEIAEELRKFLD